MGQVTGEADVTGALTGRRRSRRRGLVTASVLVVAALGFGVFAAAPAPASAPATVGRATTYSSADCTTLLSLGELTPNVSSSKSFDGKAIGAQATGYTRTAKKVKDKKLRAALLTLAGIYKKMAKAKNVVEAVAVTLAAGKSYASALSVTTGAFSQCLTSKITIPTLPKNLTIPTLPSNITLPSNLTLPTIPK